MKKIVDKVVDKTTNIIIKEATYDELVRRLAKLEADIQTKVDVKTFDELLKMHVELKVENADLKTGIMALEIQLAKTKQELAEVKEKLIASEKELAAVKEKLITTEKELAAVNEKLIATEKELAKTRQELIEVKESNIRMFNMMLQIENNISILAQSKESSMIFEISKQLTEIHDFLAIEDMKNTKKMQPDLIK